MRKYLGIVATSVASERLFSVAGLVDKCATLEPTNVEKLGFLHHNLHTSSHIDYNRSKCSCNDCVKLRFELQKNIFYMTAMYMKLFVVCSKKSFYCENCLHM